MLLSSCQQRAKKKTKIVNSNLSHFHATVTAFRMRETTNECPTELTAKKRTYGVPRQLASDPVPSEEDPLPPEEDPAPSEEEPVPSEGAPRA